MTKTVKQVVDEYLAKQNEQKRIFDYIVVIKTNGINSVETVKYTSVDDIRASIFPDIELYGMKLYKITFSHIEGNEKNIVTVIGKIIEYSETVRE
jgi:hypothetical protein